VSGQKRLNLGWQPDCKDIEVKVEKLGPDRFAVTLGETVVECSKFAAKRLAHALKTMLAERDK